MLKSDAYCAYLRDISSLANKQHYVLNDNNPTSDINTTTKQDTTVDLPH